MRRSQWIKTITAAAVLASALVLSACGGRRTGETPKTSAESAETAAAETASEVMKPEEKAEDVTEERRETEAPKTGAGPLYEGTPIPVHAEIAESHEGAQNAENFGVYSLVSSAVRLTDGAAEQYPQLQTALDSVFRNSGEIDSRRTDLKTSAKDIYDNSGEVREVMDERRLSVLRADSHVFSVLETGSWYGGGAHPESFYTGFSYDTATGRELELQDVLQDPEAFPGLVKAALLDTYPKETFFDLENDFQKYENGELKLSWVLSNSGMLVWFNPYELAPHAAGILTVSIGYDSGIFREGVGLLPESFAEAMLPDVTYALGGTTLRTYGSWEEELNDYRFHVTVGTEDHAFDQVRYYPVSYLVKKGEALYVYAFVSGDDDETWYEVIALRDRSAERIGSKDGELAKNYRKTDPPVKEEGLHVWSAEITSFAFTDPSKVILTTGKMTEGVQMHIGEDGLPQKG